MCYSRRKMITKMLIKEIAMMKKSTDFSKSKRSITIKSISTSRIRRTLKINISLLISKILKQSLSH